ncbi:MAG: hypothetical protein ACXVB0_23695 [Mucilaginibacter sp.]
MEAKKEFVTNLANQLVMSKSKMYGQDLVNELNLNGHLTSYKTIYKGGRGVYRLIDETYNNLVTESRQPEADNVANAFVDANGNPPWENK